MSLSKEELKNKMSAIEKEYIKYYEERDAKIPPRYGNIPREIVVVEEGIPLISNYVVNRVRIYVDKNGNEVRQSFG